MATSATVSPAAHASESAIVASTLPPIVFESAGTPGLYLNWLRASVFAAGLWTEPQNSSLRKTYTSVGTQVDLRFSLLHWYGMTLSVGYGAGFAGSRKAGNEWMVSLKIM